MPHGGERQPRFEGNEREKINAYNPSDQTSGGRMAMNWCADTGLPAGVASVSDKKSMRGDHLVHRL